MKRIIILILLLTGFSFVNAQIKELMRIGQTPGGSAYHVNWHETSRRLIVGCGTSLWVFDMTSPGNPVIYGKRPFLGLITETILFSNNVLFVSAGFDGIYAIDLSSPELNILDHKYLDSPLSKRAAYDLALTGDTLLIPFDGRIARYKYSHGSGFTSVGETGPIFGAFCVAAGDKFVAVGQLGIGSGKVLLYNRNNLNSPVTSWQNNPIAAVARVRFSDHNDSIIYVCGGSSNAGLNSYFHVLQFNGISLTEIASFRIDGIPVLAAANIQNIDTRNDTVYLATGCAVDTGMGAPLSYIPVLDASGLPNDSMEMTGYFNGGLWHFDIALMDGTPYMATASEWLGIVINDISGTNPIDTLPLIKTGGWTQEVKVRNDTLWVAHEGWGLAAYLIDSLLLNNGLMNKSLILHLYSQDNHFFVSDFDFINDTLLFLSSGHIFNLKPWLMGGKPDTISKIKTTWVVSVNTIHTNVGTRIIVGKEIPLINYSTLTLIDPNNPTDSSLFTTTIFNNPKSLCVKDDIIFYGAKQDSTSSLHLVASRVISDSLNSLASLQLAQDVHGIYSIVSEDTLIVAARGNRIHFISWDGTKLSHISDYNNLNMVAVGLFLKNNYLYVADRKDGVIVFDLSSPSNPLVVAKFTGRGRWKNLFGSESVTLGKDGKIYLSDFNAGVIIIEPYDLTISSGRSSETNFREVFDIYPNPASVSYSIRINTKSVNMSAPLSISIYDINGRSVANNQISGTFNTFPGDGLAKGVYFAILYENNVPVAANKLIIR